MEKTLFDGDFFHEKFWTVILGRLPVLKKNAIFLWVLHPKYTHTHLQVEHFLEEKIRSAQISREKASPFQPQRDSGFWILTQNQRLPLDLRNSVNTDTHARTHTHTL